MRIRTRVVNRKIDVDEDIYIFQDTEFMKNIRCKNIISIGGLWNISAPNITARDIQVGNIVAGDINARDINACNIDAWDITAWDINAKNIDASNILAINITARDISTSDIRAQEIDAQSITARDIKAYKIIAQDIDARMIICDKRFLKNEKAKTICKVLIQNLSKIEKNDKTKEVEK